MVKTACSWISLVTIPACDGQMDGRTVDTRTDRNMATERCIASVNQPMLSTTKQNTEIS